MKFIITILLVQVAFFASSQSKTFEEREELADSLDDAGKYEEAIVVFEALLKEDPKNTRLLNNVGGSYFRAKNFNKAKEKYRLAALYCDVNDSKTLALYYANLSASYTYLNDDEKAYEYAIKAYRINPLSELALWNAASNGQNLGKYEETIRLMDNTKIDKNNAFYTLYGRCYYNLKQYVKAYEAYGNFFENYNKDDNFITLDLEDEKSRMNTALLYVAAEESKNNESSQKYQDLAIAELTEMAKSLKKEQFEETFLSAENLFSVYDFSPKLKSKILDVLFQNPSAIQKIKLSYYSEDYTQAYALCNQMLKENSGQNNLATINLYNYLSYLHLLLKEHKADKNLPSEKLDTAIELYKNLYDKNKVYAESDFNKKELAMPVLLTLQAIKTNYPSNKEQIEGAKIALKILENTPNEMIK